MTNFEKELHQALQNKHPNVDNLLQRLHVWEAAGKELSRREERLWEQLTVQRQK